MNSASTTTGNATSAKRYELPRTRLSMFSSPAICFQGFVQPLPTPSRLLDHDLPDPFRELGASRSVSLVGNYRPRKLQRRDEAVCNCSRKFRRDVFPRSGDAGSWKTLMVACFV